ncbi:hypothetical protein GCM10010306_006690 [Streptomyces umbrinus]|nr:hypothetical protein GCM10010306_006690 [Streptomyces umbrinus]
MAAGGPVAIGKDEGLVREHGSSMPGRAVPSNSVRILRHLLSPPPPLPVPSLGAAPPDPPIGLNGLVLKRRTG